MAHGLLEYAKRNSARVVLIYALAVLVGLLAAQGGYFETSSFIASVALALGGVFLIAIGRRADLGVIVLPAVIVILSLLSSAACALGSYTFVKCAPYILFFAATICAGAMMGEERKHLLAGIELIGLVSSVIAVIWYLFLPSVAGYVSGGRLQAFFQYANTAGLWFAISALLLLDSGNKKLMASSCVSVVALLLTRSVSAIALFAAAIAVWLFLSGKFDRALVAAAILAEVVILGLLCLAFAPRLQQASQTLAERMVQWLDGARLFVSHPILGVGPGVWRFMYQGIQSAQYTARVIHNGYLQVALDCGGVALAFFVMFLVQGFRGLLLSFKRGDLGLAPVLCLAVSMAHLFFDIDWSFGLVDVMIAFLCVTGICSMHECGAAIGPLLHLQKTAAGLAVAALIASIGLTTLCAFRACLIGVGDSIEGFMSSDPEVVYNHVLRLCDEGDYEGAIDAASDHVTVMTETRVLRAGACYCLGRDTEGEDGLLSALEDAPLDVGLYKTVVQYFNDYGASSKGKMRLRELAATSDAKLRVFPASLLANQANLEGLIPF